MLVSRSPRPPFLVLTLHAHFLLPPPPVLGGMGVLPILLVKGCFLYRAYGSHIFSLSVPYGTYPVFCMSPTLMILVLMIADEVMAEARNLAGPQNAKEAVGQPLKELKIR